MQHAIISTYGGKNGKVQFCVAEQSSQVTISLTLIDTGVNQ
jgi:hypothetical protein